MLGLRRWNRYLLSELAAASLVGIGMWTAILLMNDFFFVARNDGTSAFCPDMKCHEAAVDKFQRQGGQK